MKRISNKSVEYGPPPWLDLFHVIVRVFEGEHITAEKLLPILLPLTVEMRMLQLREKGGPEEADFARAQEFGRQASDGPEEAPNPSGKPEDIKFIAHVRMGLGDGSDLLYTSQSGKGATAAMFNELAFALAVGAFLPGGVKFLDMCWHANAEELQEGLCWHRKKP